MEFIHKPVLLEQTVNSLNIKPDGIYVDGTVGGAGHSVEIAKRLNSGRLICFDQDPEAVKVATERLDGFNATVIHDNFRNMDERLKELGFDKVDGILLDIGVSSYQLDNGERGFSYKYDAPLDMRMSGEGVTAAELVNTLSADELTHIFREYGEEKFAYRIANNIEKARKQQPVETTLQLAEIIAASVPAAVRRDGNPSRKCFQALRIAVNSELDVLSEALDKAFELLAPDGRLSVITFHSLEDRMVKLRFRDYCTGCTCPPELPVCVCGKKPRGRLAFRKPITADNAELNENPRSRSAKLRTVIKAEDS